LDTGSSFESRARAAGEEFAREVANRQPRDLATDTDRFFVPFDWRVAVKKSVFPFLVGVGSVAAAAGLDWILQTEEWKARVAPYAVPVVIAAATYARNYLKQQAKQVQAQAKERE
jgi:hypothetical protein